MRVEDGEGFNAVPVSFSLLFFFLEKTVCNREGGGREGERSSQAGSTLSAHSLTWGLNPGTLRS